MTLKILKPYTNQLEEQFFYQEMSGEENPTRHWQEEKNLRVEETILGELLQDTKVLVIKKNIDL